MSDSEVFLRRSVATDNIAGPDVFGVLNEFRSDVVVVIGIQIERRDDVS